MVPTSATGLILGLLIAAALGTYIGMVLVFTGLF